MTWTSEAVCCAMETSPLLGANRDTAWRQIVSLVGLCQAVLFDSSPDPAMYDEVMERALLGITAPDNDPSDD